MIEIIASTPEDARSVYADFLYDLTMDVESEAMRAGLFEQKFPEGSGVGDGHGSGSGMGTVHHVNAAVLIGLSKMGSGFGSGDGTGNGE